MVIANRNKKTYACIEMVRKIVNICDMVYRITVMCQHKMLRTSNVLQLHLSLGFIL
jgi:hypothetical protein